MFDAKSCALLSDVDPEIRSIAPRAIRPGREHGCAGRWRVWLATEDEEATEVIADPRLWEDWSLESLSRDAAEDGFNPPDGPEAQTGTGDDPPLWKDWDPVPWLLETMLDRAEQGLGPREFGRYRTSLPVRNSPQTSGLEPGGASRT